MAGLHVPLSTLRRRPHGRRRMTRGHRGSLLLRCRAFSSLSSCRFIPAHLTFHARAADQDHVAYVPDATRPISGHPPGSSRSTPHTPRFRRHFDFDNDTSSAISTFETAHRLPDPHLTHPCAFSVSLPTTVFSQRSTRWFGASPRRATPKGPTFISRTAPHQRTSPTSPVPLCVRDTRRAQEPQPAVLGHQSGRRDGIR